DVAARAGHGSELARPRLCWTGVCGGGGRRPGGRVGRRARDWSLRRARGARRKTACTHAGAYRGAARPTAVQAARALGVGRAPGGGGSSVLDYGAARPGRCRQRVCRPGRRSGAGELRGGAAARARGGGGVLVRRATPPNPGARAGAAWLAAVARVSAPPRSG